MSEAKDTKAKRPIPSTNPPHAMAAAVDAATGDEPAIAVTPAAPVAALPPPREPTQNTADQLFAACSSTIAAFGESQRAVASGARALALEMAGLAQAHLTVAGESAVALAGARNPKDAFEIQLGFAQRGFDALVAGTMRIGEIGAQLAGDASRPIVAPLARSRYAG
jgi:hypothetical protein